MKNAIRKTIDKQTFEELFRTYYSSLCVYASRFVGRMDVAEDIVQNFYVAVWEKEYLSVFPEMFEAYAYRSIHNGCINYYKSEVTRKEFYLSLEEEWHRLIDEREEFLYKKEIHKALHKLPRKCRKVFLLKCVRELRYKEISELCGISVNTVKYHIGEAFHLLREELKDLGL